MFRFRRFFHISLCVLVQKVFTHFCLVHITLWIGFGKDLLLYHIWILLHNICRKDCLLYFLCQFRTILSRILSGSESFISISPERFCILFYVFLASILRHLHWRLYQQLRGNDMAWVLLTPSMNYERQHIALTLSPPVRCRPRGQE